MSRCSASADSPAVPLAFWSIGESSDAARICGPTLREYPPFSAARVNVRWSVWLEFVQENPVAATLSD